MSEAPRMNETELSVVGLYKLVGGDANSWDIEEVTRFDLTFAGIADDRHQGEYRVMQKYESAIIKDEVIPNDKQLSWVGTQDMIDIAEGLDLPVDDIEDRTLAPVYEFMAQNLGANILLDSRTQSLNETMKPGLILGFGTPIVEKTNAVLRTTEYNRPCNKPINAIRKSLGELGLEHAMTFDDYKAKFKKGVGRNRRGWVGSVYREGSLILGSSVHIHEPITPEETIAG